MSIAVWRGTKPLLNNEVIFVAAIPNQVCPNGRTYTERDLRAKADGVEFFWDDERRRLLGVKALTNEQRRRLGLDAKL